MEHVASWPGSFLFYMIGKMIGVWHGSDMRQPFPFLEKAASMYTAPTIQHHIITCRTGEPVPEIGQTISHYKITQGYNIPVRSPELENVAENTLPD